MKKSNDTIENRTRDLPACSVVVRNEVLHRIKDERSILSAIKRSKAK